jgi:hypothetical protein
MAAVSSSVLFIQVNVESNTYSPTKLSEPKIQCFTVKQF